MKAKERKAKQKRERKAAWRREQRRVWRLKQAELVMERAAGLRTVRFRLYDQLPNAVQPLVAGVFTVGSRLPYVDVEVEVEDE